METLSRNRAWTLLAVVAMLAAACGGGDDASGDGGTGVAGGQVVIDQETLDRAREGSEAEELSADALEDGSAAAPDEGADETSEDDDGIEVAEAEEDELDGLLNSLTLFNQCLEDAGFELEGFPGDDSGTALEDFDQAYLQALGACNTESGIADAAASFGESQANLSPEEIAATNFGLPVFRDCMVALGWEVEELVPDERGALGFGESGAGLTPPGDGGLDDFNTEDISDCRLEAEQFTEENFDPEA